MLRYFVVTDGQKYITIITFNQNVTAFIHLLITFNRHRVTPRWSHRGITRWRYNDIATRCFLCDCYLETPLESHHNDDSPGYITMKSPVFSQSNGENDFTVWLQPSYDTRVRGMTLLWRHLVVYQEVTVIVT